MYCRNCKEALADEAVGCTQCGMRPRDGNKYCHSCGDETLSQAVMCTSCGASLARPGSGSDQSNVVLAGILNWLWTGAGYFLVGQNVKGAVFCAITLCMVIVDLVTCGLGIIVHIPYAVVFIVDAVLLAQRITRGEKIGEWQFF